MGCKKLKCAQKLYHKILSHTMLLYDHLCVFLEKPASLTTKISQISKLVKTFIPQTTLGCRGSGGLGRESVLPGHCRPEATHSKKHGKHNAF